LVRARGSDEKVGSPLLNRVGDGRHAARFGNRDEGHAAVALGEPLEDRAAVFVPITEEVVENHELGALARYAALSLCIVMLY